MTSDKMSATPDKLVEFKECERFSRRNALPEQSIMPDIIGPILESTAITSEEGTSADTCPEIKAKT